MYWIAFSAQAARMAGNSRSATPDLAGPSLKIIRLECIANPTTAASTGNAVAASTGNAVVLPYVKCSVSRLGGMHEKKAAV